MSTQKIVFVVVLAVFALLAAFTVGQDAAPSAIQSSVAVQVPETVNLAVRLGIITLITAGAGWLFNQFGLDLRGSAATIALAVSAFIVGELQNIVNIVPVQFDFFLNILFHALSLLLAPVGALWLLKRNGSPAEPNTENSFL